MANDKETSVFRMISIGIVAENKALDSSLIQVLPLEKLNLMSGELTSQLGTEKIHGLDESGRLYSATIELGNSLEAEWWGETNRITPPDVRRGEQVLIYQSGDADKYYWTSTGRDDDLRRLETTVYRWSGFPDIPDEAITLNNSYIVEMSTHKKLITVKTSQRNGEFTRYTLQMNPGDGQVTLEDTHGNIIQLDTRRTNILLKNADGTLVELNKTNIYLTSSNSIVAKTKTYRIDCKTYTCNCDTYTVNGDKIALNAINGVLMSGGGGGVNINSEGSVRISSGSDIVRIKASGPITIKSDDSVTLVGPSESMGVS